MFARRIARIVDLRVQQAVNVLSICSVGFVVKRVRVDFLIQYGGFMSVPVTVIVPVFKHWSIMPAFLEKMAAQTLSPNLWQLLVVDNDSPDVPAQDELPDFVTLLSCTTPGSYAARNMGLRHAKGDLLVFTDADCQPKPDWLEAHWQAFEQNGTQSMNAGAVTVAKLTPGAPNDYELYDTFLGIPQERYATQRGYAVTANLAVPHTVFHTVGGFDDKRFSGGDAEFCQRAIKAGFGLRYIPQAEVLHPARASWSELETKARRVKGGQIRSGPFLRRAGFVLKTFVYPLISTIRVLRAPMCLDEKKRVLCVTIRLGGMGIKEMFSLLIGGNPERR